jgi:Flp pilus assembly protein TadD
MTFAQFHFFIKALTTIALVLCWASPVLSQSDEMALKNNAVKAGAGAEPTIEKLIDLGRLSEARTKMREQMAKTGEQPRLLLFEAMILYRERQYQDSLRQLDRVLNQHDADPDVHKLIGLNLVAMGREDLAGRYFEKAVNLAPHDFMARYYLGLYQVTSKQFAPAEVTVREALKLNRYYVDAWLLLGVVQEQAGKETEAIQTYQQAIELAEQQALKTEMPSLYLARLLISLQKFEPSLAPLKRAVSLNPKSAEAFTLLGRSLIQLEQNEAALQALQEAVRLLPQDKSAHYLLMGLYQKLGRKEEAQREMQIFRALEEKEKKP